MRNYNWNISQWVRQMDWRLLRPANFAFMRWLLSQVDLMHGWFLAKNVELDFRTKFNSQQKVFEHLLNSLFDASLRRIRIVTGNDDIIQRFIYFKSEAQPVNYSYFLSESALPEYVYSSVEQQSTGVFIVYLPFALQPQISSIISWLNYYKLADKKYIIIYE